MKKSLCAVLTLMLLCAAIVPASASGVTNGNVTVNGHIGISGENGPTISPDPETPGEYNITMSTAVHWWVTEANPTAVVDGNAAGPGSADNFIRNNQASMNLKVAFSSFTLENADASTIDDFLTLFLTGSLGADLVSDIDISGGYSGSIVPYTALLVKDAPWAFGFTGVYSGQLTTAGYAPEYSLTLGFSFE